MKNTLENFKPRLRPGRVIPQGARIIFETDDPYNQIVLPMALADLILLCSGQFTVRQIVEKIYRKQGVVPFKWILSAMHALHQGGFFENADELSLSPQLESWVSPKKTRWHLSWRFGQRIVADQLSPASFYALTLAFMIFAILGLQYFPASPIKMVEAWCEDAEFFSGLWSLLLFSSAVQTLRYIFCGIQLLLLTGKAYNVSLRISPWGLHLHVGDESNVLFENRLYTAMFHISQIFASWAIVYGASYLLDPTLLKGLQIVALITTGWELNPFVNSDGRKLLKSLLIPTDRDVVSWHFDKSILINTFNPELRVQDQAFARICSVWGSVWLLMALAVLHESAIFFGPNILSHLLRWDHTSLARAFGLMLWLCSLYYLVQALIEKVLAPSLGPYWMDLKLKFGRLNKNAKDAWPAKHIRNRIESLPLFSHFHEQFLDEIIAKSELMAMRPNNIVIKQGDISRELYVLLEGTVEISREHGQEEEWVSELGAVSIFGEASLVDESARAAMVKTKTDAIILKTRVAVIRQVAHDAATIRHLEDFRNAILVNQFFASSPVFRSLSTDSIDFLCNRGTLEYFNLGQYVFQQGEQGDSIFLILRGSVEVFVHGKRIKSLRQGSFFGEIALIANIPRTATITTCEPCIFFKVSSDSFWEVLVQYMDLGVFIETISESRLREDLEVSLPTKRTGSDSE